MGFSIPDSTRDQNDAATQSDSTLASSGAGAREGSRQSLVARRRNAIVPGSLSFDALGSPRSPFVFLSQESRRAIAQRQEPEQGQEQQQQSEAKAMPSIRRHVAANCGTAQNVHNIP
ncbi:hypothetical protein PRIC2_003453 [Phytophthora ramorum]